MNKKIAFFLVLSIALLAGFALAYSITSLEQADRESYAVFLPGIRENTGPNENAQETGGEHSPATPELLPEPTTPPPQNTPAPSGVPPASGELPASTAATDPGEPALIHLPLIHKSPDTPFLTRNVIILIGDGMGPEQIKAAGMYLNGSEGSLPFEQFPDQAVMTTHAADHSVTDSAAAASAIATGYKTKRKVVSLALPGDGRPLYTLLEYARDWRMSTGLVTTTEINHATMASFGAHAESRENYDEIAADFLRDSRPNVLFGGSRGVTPEMAAGAGYTVVTDRDGLFRLDTENVAYVSGQFSSGAIPFETDGLGSAPHLSEMTRIALQILDNDPDGLFLVVEGGRIDAAAHNNETDRMLGEMVEFCNAVQAALDWALSHPDTLILVVSDHETGGLAVTRNNGAGQMPDVTWSTTGHTGIPVRAYLYGVGRDILPEQIDNTHIPALISGGMFPPP